MPDILDRIRTTALAQIADGAPAAEILAEICRDVQAELPGTIVGVTILDRTSQLFEHAVFPSLSNEYAEALRGIAVVDRPGSCALAVYEGLTVTCDDVESDDRFAEGWKALGLRHGLRALISIPAVHDGLVLGTLVVAFQPKSPLSGAQRQLADTVAGLCAQILMYRRNQLRQELLVGELQHRTRNLFSAIGAVVYATLRAYPEPEAFRKMFDGRLTALAKAHSLTLEGVEADLRLLIADMLAPYSIDHEVIVEGPKLVLSQEAAVAFSLATHELATNAAKYGAFSQKGGSVRVDWAFDEDMDGKSRFQLRWEEQGGPAVSKPTRQGFGQRTLSRSLASAFDGKVDLDYRPEGLRCRVVAPHSPRLGARPN